jgi:hypothetical protein
MTESKLAKYEPRKQDAALMAQGSTTFLPPIKLMSGMSKPVKAKKAVVGDWFLGQETNLGQETEFVVIEGLPHALQLDEKNKVTAESFDPNDPVFKTIQAARAKYAKGAMWGFNYLLWSTKVKQFGTYFINKSAKQAAPDFEARLGLHVSATSWEKTFNTGNTAMIPRLTTLQDEPSAMFSQADLEAALAIFRNSKPRDQGQEMDEDGNSSSPAPKAGGRSARKAA